MADIASLLFSVAAAAMLGFVLVERWTNPIHSIPTVGPSAPLLSYIGAFGYVYRAKEMMAEGLQKYGESVFKIAMIDHWMVIVNGPTLINELRKFPDNQMSLVEATDDIVHVRACVASDILEEPPYHTHAIRSQLTRNLASLMPDMVDEMQVTFKELVPNHGDEWLSILAFPTMSRIVARVINRVFVGKPLCRDEDFVDISIGFTSAVLKVGVVTTLIPDFLLPVVGPLIPWAKQNIRRGTAHLKPIIEERLRELERYGDSEWPDKPNDFLMWLMEEARKYGRAVDDIIQKLFLTYFAAMSSSSASVTHALYYLAENPQYMKPLREEVEEAIKDGWTLASIQKMIKLDSFLRESERMNGAAGVILLRKALQDVTLSNGVRIPAGTIVVANAPGIHNDADRYTNPMQFDPFRFSKMETEGMGARVRFVNTSIDYLSFGLGAHTCPGRFFAASQLTAILAHIVLNFDVKFEREGERPSNEQRGAMNFPARKAKVMFRRRQPTVD